MNSTPMVSIVLPVYGRLRYLRQSIESVFVQDFTDWELIIADDGSDDETRDYLRSIGQRPGVRVLWLAHTGNPGSVRNAALAEARGCYIAFLDSDDYWLPGKLTRQLAAMRTDGKRRWSYTAYECVDEAGRPIEMRWVPYSGAIFDQILTMDAYVAMPTVLAERALVEEAGRFDPGQVQHGDYELWLRLVMRSDVLLVDEPLARVRNHQQHYTRGGTWALRWKRRMFEKVQGLVSDPQRSRTVRAARAANAAQLVRAHAAAGERAEAARVMVQSLAYSWWRLRWWGSVAISVIRAFTVAR
jgi:glycosyltransferase involved in cell wall biosynthesis